MGNHWHLVVWPQEDDELSRFVGWLEHVNSTQTDAELVAIRRCIKRGSPFGDETGPTLRQGNSALRSRLARRADQNPNKRFLTPFVSPRLNCYDRVRSIGEGLNCSTFRSRNRSVWQNLPHFIGRDRTTVTDGSNIPTIAKTELPEPPLPAIEPFSFRSEMIDSRRSLPLRRSPSRSRSPVYRQRHSIGMPGRFKWCL